jgi:hypothetical protein
MRMIADSNYLQDKRLRSYLAASTNNYAVLTDYAAMEAYKGNTLVSIYRSMEILAEYPKQVMVLKGTQVICDLSGRDATSQESLIDKSQSLEFPEYCRKLLAAKTGDLSLERQLLELGREATRHMDRMQLCDMPTLSKGIDLMMKAGAPVKLKGLREGKHLPQAMHDKLVQDVRSLATELFKTHPTVTEIPILPDLRDTFIFRYALCAYISILRGIECGGVKTNPKKLRNDVVDVNFATFATYFDGLLTADKRAGEIYEDAKLLLREIFARPPAWLWWLLRRGWFS